MKIKSERDKRTYLIIALCAILVVMGVGYAAFSSMLTINGTANISNSWCVGFDNTMTSAMEVTKGVSTGTTPTGSMTYSGTACGSTLQPNSSLNAHFYQPGDQIEYTLTITNKSTVAAAIKSILVDNESVTQNTTKKKGNITYVVEMPADTTLAVNESTTMKVIAKFQNETDVTGPYSGETKTIEVKINAEEDDGNGGMDITPAKFTGTIYRWSTRQVSNGDSIGNWEEYTLKNVTKWEETNGSYSQGTFDTEEKCQADIDNNEYAQYGIYCQQKIVTTMVGDYTTDASELNKTYYLKHDVVDDIITASYLCFVYNNAEHCMKGGDETSFAVNTQIIQDYQTFYNLGDYDPEVSMSRGCYFDSSYSYCYSGGFDRVLADSYGNMSVSGYNDAGVCGIGINSSDIGSYCQQF